MAPLNVAHLEELFTEDADNFDRIHQWYERLSEYELQGDETREALEMIARALKWIMQFEHTRAEELKELAEKEAADIAEREENWEEERENMKKELRCLREKITSTAGADELNETFRAQIDSLREENAYLKAQNRDRDCELADQRDKAEELSSRIEQLEKERNTLISQQSHFDDTIRELNRRLSSKSEQSARSESETRKQRQRNEQTAKLSSQLQEVIHQNDQLTAEVERLSEALSSATGYIEDTTEKYANMREQLLNTDAIIERLSNENATLAKQIEEGREALEKLESTEVESARRFESMVKRKDTQLEKFRESIQSLQRLLLKLELEETRARSRLDRSEERERELERLRNELVDATNLARELFGKTASSDDRQQSAQLRLKVLELDKMVETLREQLKDEAKQREELVRNLEAKDTENMRIHAEMKRIRVTTFGSAESEISRLEVQLKFRDVQIEKLTTKCSLLQAELASYIERDAGTVASDYDAVAALCEEAETKQYETQTGETLKKVTADKGIETERASSPGSTKMEIQQRRVAEEKLKGRALDSWEASAMLISSLNYELMLLMQELDTKEKQLQKMEKVSSNALADINKMKANYSVLQKEAVEFREKRNITENVENNAKITEYEIQLEEYKRLAESVHLHGSELERRLEEASRRLIAERIHSAQTDRKLQIMERYRDEERELCAKLRRKLNENMSLHSRQIRLANYEADLTAIEMARLQNILLHSVPEIEYEKLTKKYKTMLQQEFFYTNDTDDVQFNEHFGVELLKKATEETVDAEAVAKNEYYKNMIAVLSDQNEYWQSENEKIRAENDELKRFLEDIETESTVKAMIVAIERRFLSVLAEKSEREQDELLVTSQTRQIQNEFARKRREWAAERKKLIAVIQNVQMSAQRIRRNAMEMITVEQMIELKDRIANIHENQLRSERELEEASKQKEEISMQLMNVEALKRSLGELKESDCDLIKLQKALQASHLNQLNITSQLNVLKSQLEKKDAELASQEEQIDELRKQLSAFTDLNYDIETALLNDGFEEKKTDERDQIDSVQRKAENETTKTSTLHSSDVTIDVEKHRAGLWPDSSRVSVDSEESPAVGEDTLSSTTNAELRTKTVVFDNSKEYEKKIRYIRETAEVCIQNYKDQLSYKEQAIKKYRALLEKFQNQRDAAERQKYNEAHEELPEEKRWKRSEEILDGKELEEKRSEILKLRNEIKELEEANRHLSEQIQQQNGGSEEAELYDAGVQTDLGESGCLGGELKPHDTEAFLDDEATQERYSEEDAQTGGAGYSRPAPSASTETTERTHEERSTSERAFDGSSLNQPKVEGQPKSQKEEQLSEFLRQEQSTSAVLRTEIKRLKQRLATATAKNRELQQACEDIRAEALAQIGQKYTKNGTDSADLETAHLRRELEKLGAEVSKQRRTIKSQKETIEALQMEHKKEETKTTEDELARWREKKLREGSVSVLRKKLNEAEEREREMQQKLARRDRRIAQMQREENATIADRERLSATIADLKRRNETLVNERDEANVKLTASQEALSAFNQQISVLKKENSNLNLKIQKMETISREIQDMKIVRIAGEVTAEQIKERGGAQEMELRYEEAMGRLSMVQKEYDNLRNDYEKLLKREKARKKDKEGSAAVAVLRDKLMAKEKVIEQLSERLDQFEREKWKNML
ncbi:unnamed protein product [Toxocara canis]|uniref:Myosin_tail_1 domain-containing protein n=1 Tax=Toxocara canis TaxID=6265 RepID=A0A183UCR4_TOXCA|nr:unnamed protein product [Toxocara canis]